VTARRRQQPGGRSGAGSGALVSAGSATLGHERTHVWQVRTYGYPDDDALARLMEDGAKVTEAQWWDCYQMNQRP
jgi:hypothetical protein